MAHALQSNWKRSLPRLRGCIVGVESKHSRNERPTGCLLLHSSRKKGQLSVSSACCQSEVSIFPLTVRLTASNSTRIQRERAGCESCDARLLLRIDNLVASKPLRVAVTVRLGVYYYYYSDKIHIGAVMRLLQRTAVVLRFESNCALCVVVFTSCLTSMPTFSG